MTKKNAGSKRRYKPPTVSGGKGRFSIMIHHRSHVVIDVKKALRALGSWTVGRVKLRTQQGVDIKGRPFVQYSRGYERSLRRGGENTSPIDLRVSGTMMGDLKVKKRGKRLGVHFVTIGFANKKMRKYRLKDNQIQFVGESKITTGHLAAVHHRGHGRMPARRFMGLSKLDRKEASRYAYSKSIVRQLSGPPRRVVR